MALPIGNTEIRVKVTAEDDTTTGFYVVTVTRTLEALTPPADALVSSIGQGIGYVNSRKAIAQSFTTGSNESGYTLTGVDVASASSTAFTAQVCGADTNGAPTSTCWNLTAPDSFALGAVSFTAPANTVLVKDTTYAVVVTADGNTQGWGSTSNNDEDAGKADGWSIRNNSYFRHYYHAPTTWNSEPDALRMAVRGSAVGGTLSTDATLSALSVTARLPLMTFVSGTTSYATSVKHDVDEVKVAATTNDSNATFEIQDASDMTLTDADISANGFQVELAASATVIKVKVTAEDRTTTQTYTVTVTRAVITPVTPPADALVSNVSQSSNSNSYFDKATAQGFTTGSNASGYTLTGVDVLSASTTGFTAQVCGTDSSGLPTSTCTALTAPGSIAVGKNAFTAPANTTLVKDTTYAVVVTADGATQGWGVTGADGEDAGKADGWSIADTRPTRKAGSTWGPSSKTTALRVAVRGSAVGGTANNAPVFSPTTATREVAENSAAGTNVGAAIPEATDADSGDTLTYSMEGTDAASFAFDASTRQITTITGVDYDFEATQNTYEVTVKAADGNGGTATVDVTIDVTDVNEKSAKPDKPTLAAVTGSSTTLTATWTKPDLDGGPEIAGYAVQYREGTTGTWTAFAHTGAALTTTITGLTADTSYQVRVRAKNGETDSDWSDASDAVKTNAAAVAPTIDDVEITSTPVLETDTYGLGETIEISVTFSEAVNATFNTDFVLSVDGDKRARLLRGLGTETLAFGYTVVSGDDDDNGIWIGNEDRTLVGDRHGMTQHGAITSEATSTAADLTHSELGQQSDHKVDGSRSIVSVAVSSTPMLETDTYGATETIRFTVTFNGRVNVTGDPVLRFVLGNSGEVREVDAAYEGGTGSTALVFGYTVVSTDEDNNGIYLRDEQDYDNPDGPVRLDSDDTIRFAVTDTDVPLYWQGRGNHPNHKVDGSRTTGNNAPVFTSSASLSVEENTLTATVVAVDNDTDDDITGYAITGGTDLAFFSEVTSAGVLSFNEAPNFEDPKDSGTDNTYVVTVEATSGTGTREMTATQTITVTVTDADEKSAKPDKPTLAKVTGSSTTLTATWTKPGLNGGPDITGYAVQYKVNTATTWEDFAHTGTAVTTTVTGLTADTSYQVQVRAKNGETDSDWSDASDAVKTNAEMATTCTLNTGDVWCAVLTVGSNSAGSRNGYHSGQYGQLSDTKFDLSSTEYTVESIRWVTATGQSKDLILDLDGLPAEDVWRTWHLQVDANKFSTTNVEPLGTDDQLRFENAYEARPYPALNTAVTVRLTTSSTGALEVNAQLSALTVKDGNADLTLSPAFDQGTYAYTTSAASDVETVTFTATAIDRGSVRYQVGTTTLVDADATAPGFQVTLDAGANTIDVIVVSEDGGFSDFYRVTVTRAGALATPTSFTATVGDTQVTLAWDAPGSGATGHEYRFVTFPIGSSYDEGYTLFGPWTQIPDSGVGGANEAGFTVTESHQRQVVHIFQAPRGERRRLQRAGDLGGGDADGRRRLSRRHHHLGRGRSGRLGHGRHRIGGRP